MQTQSLLTALGKSLDNGYLILDADRMKVESLAKDLRAALNQSTIESERSVLPGDLETAANFVEVVAK